MTLSNVTPEYLFVYGTLLTGAPDPQVERVFFQCCASVDQGVTRGRLYDLGEYPGAVLSDDHRDLIKGEVFRVDRSAECFPVLDEYEDCFSYDVAGSEFVRRKAKVSLLNKNDSVECWVYLYNRMIQPGHQQIVSGDWRSHTGKTEK